MSSAVLELDELEAMRDQARRLLRETVTPDGLKKLLDTPGGFDKTLWDHAVAAGWPGLAVDESAGGLGLGWHGLAVLSEALGEANGSLPLIAGAVLARACVESGEKQLIHNIAEPVASGQLIACMAWTQTGEAGLSSMPKLRLENGRLFGSTGITAFAAVADVALLVASEDQRQVLLAVFLDAPAVKREIEPSLDNARAAARLNFTGAQVNQISISSGAPVQVARLDALAALATASEQLGGASACLLMARDYALQRVAFGQQIGRFQAIKHKLADMYTRIEIARGCVIDALQAETAGDDQWIAFASAARLAAIDAYDFAARENVQTHGGLGTTWEAMPHHHYRRARALAVEMGSKVYWRERLLTEIGV